MRKVILFLTVLVFWHLTYAQDTGAKNGVQLIDFHYGDVTDVQYIPERNEIYSSDATGKIIVHDATTQKYKFTFLEADGVGARRMLLLNKNRLIVHKAYATMDGTKPDSLFAYDVPKKLKVTSQGFNVKLLGNDIETYGSFSISKGYEHGLVMMKRDPFESVATIGSKAPVVAASSAVDGSKIAFVEEQYGRASLVVKAIDNSELFREDISELIGTISSFKVLYEDAGSILLVINNTTSETISIYRYNSSYEKNLVEKIKGKPGFKLICEMTQSNEVKQFFLGTNTVSFQNEYIVGTMKNGIYELERVKTDKNFSYAYLSKATDKITFYSLSGDLSSYNKPITRYQIIKDKKEALDGTAAFGNYRGEFLASGDLLFIGKAGNEQEEIKLFTAGTLQNKFAPLSYREYLERNHDLIVYDYSFVDQQIDPLSSSIAVLADFKGKRRIVSYNFTTEQISKLSEDITDGFTVVRSFHGKTSQVILSKVSYLKSKADKDSESLKWCKAGNCKIIKGSYKQAQFSRDGKFLITLDNTNLLELRELPSLKVVAQKQIDGTPNVNLNYSDNNEFEISLNYGYSLEGCYLKHISLLIKDGSYDFQERDCLGVIDSDFQNGMQAALLNFVGVLVGDQLYDTDKSVDPQSLSLNNDGTKLLVNYKHGLVELFDVASKQKDLSVIQPDYDSHLFVDQSGYYISNFKADDLVIGYQNGKVTSLNVLKSKFYKPSIILQRIGKVDAEYAATLAKAEQIRATFTSQETNAKEQIQNFQLKAGDLNETNDLVNTFTFQTSELDKKETLVYLNGVEVQEAKITDDGSNNYSFELELAALENIIELRTETGTVLASKTIAYKGTDLNPNLFVLAVGVSDYEQAKYNLTFAAKDAMDIAQLYGNLSQEEITRYENKFYAKPLFLTNLNGDKIGKEVRFYDGKFPFNNFFSVSVDGNYWIGTGVEKTALYNFKTGTIKLLDYNEFNDDTHYLSQNKFISDPDNKGFYYVFNGERKFYNFKTNTITVVKLSIDEDELRYNDNIHLLTDNRWLTFNTGYFSRQDEYGDKIIFTKSKDGNIVKEQFIEFKNAYSFSMIAHSQNGDFALIKLREDEVELYDLRGDQPQFISKSVFKDYNVTDRLTVSNDGLKIQLLQDSFSYGGERIKKLIIFDNSFKVLQERELTIGYDNGLLNILTSNDGPILLKRSSSTAQSRSYLSNENIEDIVKNRSATAASFQNTQVKYLLNDDASKKNILKELKSLQQNVRPQDQVVVFIAGHGVLDEELNYYYAPHDMDFENVTKNGVSFDDIIQGLNETSSTKMLLLMDTCHSGNTLDMDDYEIVEESVEDKDGRKKRGGVAATTSNNGDKTTVSQVVSTLFDNFTSVSGVTVISASSGQDVAYESEELSNGAFTTAYITYLQEQLGQDYATKADYSKPLNLSDDFIKELRKRILDYTSNKQQLDIREINELSGIRVW